MYVCMSSLNTSAISCSYHSRLSGVGVFIIIPFVMAHVRTLQLLNVKFTRFLLLQTFHTHILQLFASGDHSVLEHCLKWLVPCVQMMAQDQTHLMNQVTVSIRKEWCNRLEEDDLTESE